MKELKHVEKRPGPSRTGVWAICDPTRTGEEAIVGKVIAAYPADGAGRLFLALWDWSDPNHISRDVQQSSTDVFGSDKVGAAMSGLVFGPEGREIKFTEPNWDMELERAGWQVRRLL